MAEKIFLYAGTWTVQAKGVNGGGIGIYRYVPETGRAEYLETVRQDLVAGKLCIDEKRGVLYAVDEVRDSPRFGNLGGGGRVIAFRIDRETGHLTELGEERSTIGTQPLYLAIDGSGKWLLISNHGDKSAITVPFRDEAGKWHVTTRFSPVTAVILPIAEDGSLGEAADVASFDYDRTSVPPVSPCLHCVAFADDGEHFLMMNMKQDMLLMYRIDREKGILRECDRIYVDGGAYPHYAVLNPEKKLFYVNCEHKPFIYTVSYEENGRLTIRQKLEVPPTLQHDMTGKKVLQTDIILSADGKHVYDLWRGTNTVQVLNVDGGSGMLEKGQELLIGTDGNPRGGAVSPDGRFLLAADNDNHLIRTLAVAPDGGLSDTGITEGTLKYPANLAFFRA